MLRCTSYRNNADCAVADAGIKKGGFPKDDEREAQVTPPHGVRNFELPVKFLTTYGSACRKKYRS